MRPQILHIAVDSNFLKRDRTFSKPDLLFIKALCQMKLVKLHIPWFVYKECTSTYVDETMTELESISLKLTNIKKKGLHEIEGQEAKKIAADINLLKERIQNSVEMLWNTFIKDTNAVLHKYEASESEQVFENYFNGGKPFKSLKSRVDIPDAFIYMTLKKISKQYNVHFITEDNNLRDKFTNETFIWAYKTYQDFFSSNIFQPTQREYEKLKKYESLNEILINRLDEISEAVLDFLSDFKSFSILDRNINSENNQATVNSISDAQVVILKEEIKFVDDVFYIPIVARGYASVDYFIFKPDYYLDDHRKEVISDWNEHYFLAEHVIPLELKKIIKIPGDQISEDLDLPVEINSFDEITVGKD